MEVKDLERETGLSRYLLSVFYDFYEYRLYPQRERSVKEKRNERLEEIVCPNFDLTPIRKKPSENEIRSLIKEYEQTLGKMTPQERDEAMVFKFLGWAKTHSGHVIMIHYHGLTKERKELVKLCNWSPLHKKYLPLFHTRFSKDRSLSLPLRMTFSDLRASVDVRFVVNKWFDSINESQRTLLRENQHLLERVKLIKKPMSIKESPILLEARRVSDIIGSLLEKMDTKIQALPHEEEEEEEESEDDPYEVKEEKYRTVSKDEYSKKTQLHKDMRFTLHDYTEASRRSFLSKVHIHPEEYHQFNPILLVDASAIALHMEGQVKRASAEIALQFLQVVENGDTTKILNFFVQNKRAREELKRYYEEYIYSLLCLADTTDHLPQHILDHLNPFEELSMTIQ